jgi:hypothetical protein
MAQSDQVVQNATFPSVRADINDNLAALYSQSSGNSAPTVTVAFQPWVDTSSSPPVWKVRNGSNSAWITVGILDPAGFNAGGITAIANGGTGATTATAGLAALLPSQTGNAGKALVTSGSAASWGVVASGASVQVFTANGTYTPTAGKTTFLVFATGGGGGGGGSNDLSGAGGGGGGGTAVRLYTSTEMGSTAAITIGGAGAGGTSNNDGGGGGSTTFDPSGTGLTITGNGGGGGNGAYNDEGSYIGGYGGGGGGSTNSQFAIDGNSGSSGSGPQGRSGNKGSSFWAGGRGSGGTGGNGGSGAAGIAGGVFIIEW